jgi:quercetin dioxygenase-like cupin family protein
MRTIWIALAACGLAACATTEPPAADAALAAFQNAHMRACPADRVQANAHASGEAQSAGAHVEDLAIVPAAGEPSRALRLRRITVAPGGTIGWHDHTAVQGAALLVSGEMVETRNTCLDPITYRAGDIAREDAETAHSWRNESDQTAVILVAHVIAR